MAPLPKTHKDPTLEAVDRAIEKRDNASPARPYLGMSAIGDKCRRKLWYSYRWALKPAFDALTLKRFEDGHRVEDLQAERLRLVDGVTLITVDPETGRQIGFSDHDGNFRGHADGVILGILQAPRTWHVWEHKATADKKQNELDKLKRERGEKNALKEWNPVYYAQAVLYMDYAGLNRHYMTCSTPGGRHTISVRTNADPDEAARLKLKAAAIINSPAPLEKASQNPDWFECKWCDYHSLCHGDAAAERNCRTCIFSKPGRDGVWTCNKQESRDLTVDEQRVGCGDHRYVPGLVPGEQIDAAEDGSWISYKLADGGAWTDVGEAA